MMVAFNVAIAVVLAFWHHPWSGLAWLFCSLGAWAVGDFVREKLPQLTFYARVFQKRAISWANVTKRYILSLLENTRRL